MSEDNTDGKKPDPRGKKIVGIDLGTTFSCIAHIDEHGKPEIILNNDAQPTTASAVWLESDDNIVVGQLAKDNTVVYPHDIVILVKRLMGQDIPVTANGKDYTPEEISAMILKKLKQDAEQRLSIDCITDAVITVPAWFGAAQTKATQDAGEMAGFTVHRTLAEPVAAALAFGFSAPRREQTLLVYDLGGGTFDITLFKIAPPDDGSIPRITMISTGGDHELGGANWDERIVHYAATEFMEKFPESAGESADPRDVPESWQDLRIKCERAKISLARMGKTRISVQHGGNTHIVELDRDKLKSLTQDLLDQTETHLDNLLESCRDRLQDGDPNTTPDSKIDQVLCVGGSTKLEMVRDMLNRKFPGKVNTDIDPDLSVAQGAAWMGHLLSTLSSPEEFPVTVAPHALGVKALNAQDEPKIFPLIVKDTPLSCTGKDVFLTGGTNQTEVTIAVFENESTDLNESVEVEASREIGSVVIKGLPYGRPAGQQIEVTFEFDTSFRLSVHARDVATDTAASGVMELGSNIDVVKKAQMTKRLESTEIQS